MARKWTDEQKTRQRELIRTWRPWERSTGPRTAEGKAKSAKNRQHALDAAQGELEAARQSVNRAFLKLARIRGGSLLKVI